MDQGSRAAERGERWRIELLGRLRAIRGDRVVSRLRSRKTGLLLAYLACFPERAHPREELIEQLWPGIEPGSGRNRLSLALSALRRALATGDDSRVVLHADRTTVRLNPDAFTTDVAELQSALARAERTADRAERIEALTRAVGLYGGELLPGYHDDWVVQERAWLAEAYFQAVSRLVMLLQEVGEGRRALECACGAVRADPLREEAHQDLMRLLATAGQGTAALQQYRELERLLRQELDTLPTAATSRASLCVRGEQEFLVEPLPVPEGSGQWPVVSGQNPVPQLTTDHGPPTTSPSVQLFVERAKAVRHGFALTGESAAAVAEICRRLEGIPLSIELAAARTRLFSPRELLVRLETRLPLLTGGPRDLPLRQQALWDAIAWSHDLLSEAERCLFRRVSVFAGGFTVAAAEAVCGPDQRRRTNDQRQGGEGIGRSSLVVGQDEVLHALASLAAQSLLRRVENGDGESRFVLLETIREFGQECLQASGEETKTREQHARFFLTLAEEANARHRDPADVTWWTPQEREQDNLRAALAWLMERAREGDPGTAEIGLRLGEALWEFWEHRGHWSEGRTRLAELLSLPGASDRSAARAEALRGLGGLVENSDGVAASRPFYEESLAIWRELGDRRGIGRLLHCLAHGWHIEDDYERQRVLVEEALAIWEEIGEQAGVLAARDSIGGIAYRTGDYATARATWEETLAIQRELGNGGAVANRLWKSRL